MRSPDPMSLPPGTIDQYAVTRDGQRCLLIQPRPDAAAVAPITVVLNWATGLTEK